MLCQFNTLVGLRRDFTQLGVSFAKSVAKKYTKAQFRSRDMTSSPFRVVGRQLPLRRRLLGVSSANHLVDILQSGVQRCVCTRRCGRVFFSLRSVTHMICS